MSELKKEKTSYLKEFTKGILQPVSYTHLTLPTKA